jgi:hypothetical protein
VFAVCRTENALCEAGVSALADMRNLNTTITPIRFITNPNHTNTNTMTRREQFVISCLCTGYTRATHSAVMDKEPSLECPFCTVHLTTDYILWHWNETETKRLQMDITKEIWKGGKQVFLHWGQKNRCFDHRFEHVPNSPTDFISPPNVTY